MAFDTNNPALRDTEHRKGEFREMARDIVWKDRDSRKFGRSVDTGGAIARALEAAYKLGIAHGAKGAAPVPAAEADTNTYPPSIAWNTIPPRPRAAFQRILSFKWVVLLMPSTDSLLKQPDRWACYWTFDRKNDEERPYELAETFSRTTLAPLIRLGLMEELKVSGQTVLEPTQIAAATWARALEEGRVEDVMPNRTAPGA